ncbi:DUF1569 domain-containing protein [Mucisphaera sp.]|uniref:DUF1569 domain-containing protein n=1 Tax=Mucisphaera sp. TaxID=2913024 RepID=UPI003D09D9E7
MPDLPKRRDLLNKFSGPADILEECERLAACEREGRLVMVGGWTLAQNINHLAQLMHRTVDGFEPDLRVNPLLAWTMRTFMKKRLLTKLPPTGLKLSPAFQRVFIAEPSLETEAALDNMRKGVEKSKASNTRHPSPILGQLTIDEWNAFQSRHAEHHLSFAVPQ